MGIEADPSLLRTEVRQDLFRRLDIEEMVWRYDGEDVPENLVEKFLRIWQDLAPDINHQLGILKQNGWHELEIIKEKVNNYKR